MLARLRSVAGGAAAGAAAGGHYDDGCWRLEDVGDLVLRSVLPPRVSVQLSASAPAVAHLLWHIAKKGFQAGSFGGVAVSGAVALAERGAEGSANPLLVLPVQADWASCHPLFGVKR
eukprot:XP_001702254.1 predicted protein [Chlamydomonas reinhardtii]